LERIEEGFKESCREYEDELMLVVVVVVMGKGLGNWAWRNQWNMDGKVAVGAGG